MNWKIKKIKVSELKENPSNPRRLTEKGLKDLEKSILKFGIAEPLVVNTDYMICGGHGRKKILEKLNIKEVDCYLPDKLLSKKQFDELGIRLNKNIAGEFNFDTLANEFEIDELIEWGFEKWEFGVDADEKQNEKEEWDGMPEFENNPLGVKTIYVHFKTVKDVEEFAKLTKQIINIKKTKSIWFPYKERENRKEIYYES